MLPFFIIPVINMPYQYENTFCATILKFKRDESNV